MTLPLLLLVCIGIFEFGRAYQTQQVLVNAAREGARLAMITDHTDQQVTEAVRNYITSGRLTSPGSATVTINRTEAMGAGSASRVTVSYPFNFIVLNPVIILVVKTSSSGQASLTMLSVGVMRNEL